MDTASIDSLRRAIGIPLAVMAILLLLIALFVAYRNYLEVKSLKLKIELQKLKLDDYEDEPEMQ